MGRSLPTECEHGTTTDWGDFGPEDGPEPVCSRCLRPGQALQSEATGSVVILDRRKEPGESHLGGWWLRDSKGGLADQAIEGGLWLVVDGVRPDHCPTCGQSWPAEDHGRGSDDA